MEFPEAQEMLNYIFREDRKERLYLAWLHDCSGLTFDKYLEQFEPKQPEPVRASADILAETDELFKGR